MSGRVNQFVIYRVRRDKREIRVIKAYNIGGYNYCRLRDIGMNLFFTVDYDKEANSILVTTKE